LKEFDEDGNQEIGFEEFSNMMKNIFETKIYNL
jgi:hypothetical protein